jgi:hypothetical protein
MTTKIDLSKYVSPMAGLLNDPARVKAKKFKDAAKYVSEGMTLNVSTRGTWYGTFEGECGAFYGDPSRHVQSYERIGYHSGAEWFLEGFLSAGGKVIFQGFDGIKGPVSL